MEHLIFLIQIITLVLAFSSLILLIPIYFRGREKTSLYFSIAIFLIMMRTVIFAIARYGMLSRFFLFSVRFATSLWGGLVYSSLVYVSHFFLLLAINRLAEKRHPCFLYGLFSIVSFYSVGLYGLIISGTGRGFIPYSLMNVIGLSVVPILTVKGLLGVSGFFLAFRCRENKRLALFLVLLVTGQIADGLFFAFEPLRITTLLLSLVFPYSAYLIVLPKILKTRGKRSPYNNHSGLESFIREYNLNEEEKEIVIAIREGKSNKEIAYENNITLSIVKHRIFRLYRKCGINSRWELLALL